MSNKQPRDPARFAQGGVARLPTYPMTDAPSLELSTLLFTVL